MTENYIPPNKLTFEDFSKYVDVSLYTYGLVNEIDLKTGLNVTSEKIKYSQNIQSYDQKFLMAHADISPIITVLKDVYKYSDITLLFGTPITVTANLGPVSIFGFIAKDTTTNTGIISIRGTNENKDWITNINIGSKRLNTIPELKSLSNNIEAYKGFVNLYGINGFGNFKMSSQIDSWVRSRQDINNYVVIGHSLGAALATIASYHLKKIFNKDVKAYLYSSPRVCGSIMAKDYNNLLFDSTYNFYNCLDIVHQANLSVIATDAIELLSLKSTSKSCLNHVGQLSSINYVSEEWKENAIVNSHLLGTCYYPEKLKKIWKEQVFTKSMSTLNYSNFKLYSTILNTLFNEINLINSVYKSVTYVPLVVKKAIQVPVQNYLESAFKNLFLWEGYNSITDNFPKYFSKYGITAITPLLISSINSVNKTITEYCVGIVGKMDADTGIIITGIEYNTFPVDLNLPTMVKYNNNFNFGQQQYVIKTFNDFYYKCSKTESYNNNNCIKDILDNWIKSNQKINNFTIIGQNAGSSFGILAAIDLMRSGKKINEVYLYGSIKTGDLNFANAYNNTYLGQITYNFLNIQDPYTNLLPAGLGAPHCGKVYDLDISPPNSKCDFDYFQYVRNPRAYLNVPEWKTALM